MNDYIALDHSRFAKAQRAIFTSRVTPECMTHSCRLLKEDNRLKLDACCQYGVDVDIAERDAILRRQAEIADILDDEVADGPWFGDAETDDVDFPSGRYVRTRTHNEGCLFLAHDGRGCAIHRASIAGGWDFRGTKPHVCRLFPVSYESDAIVLSDDYSDYSCSRDASAPTVYRVSRETIADVFGPELVAALDRAEAAVLGTRAGLRVVAS